MALSGERMRYLLEAYTSGRATDAEETELFNHMHEAGEDPGLRAYMLDAWEKYRPAGGVSDVDWSSMFARIMQPSTAPADPKVRRMTWLRIAAAAVLILMAGLGYRYFAGTPERVIAAQPPKQHDIAPPRTNKALLTLADGTKIALDSTGNGMLALQGKVKVVKQSDGQISYTGAADGAIGYNTLTVPRGTRPMGLVLSDGTKVWLNLGSSLTYPTAFSGNERRVKITGEAYFEVAPNAKMPFVVQNQDLLLHVLGTHFDVNTYDDEAAGRITLLEGSVRVSKGSISTLLKPGQQAQITSTINVRDHVDIGEVMAWKEGKFRFGEDSDIGTIMRQIARWYNVQPEYRGEIKQRFWGSVSRDVNISDVLKVLEATKGVKFQVTGNKIIVMPAAP